MMDRMRIFQNLAPLTNKTHAHAHTKINKRKHTYREKERGGGEIVIERERQRDRETERERLDSNHLSDDSIPHTPLVKYRVTVRNANCFKKKKKKKKEKTNRSSLRYWERKNNHTPVHKQ